MCRWEGQVGDGAAVAVASLEMASELMKARVMSRLVVMLGAKEALVEPERHQAYFRF